MSDFIGLISDDLLIAILVRLPVETLIRCTKVCKLWYSLITNPSFINTHLNHTNKNHNLLLIHYFSSKNNEEIHSLVRYENNVSTDYAHFQPPLYFVIDAPLRILGTSDGLICLSDFSDYTYFLWNPSIRKIMRLPKVSFTLEFYAEDTYIPLVHTIGFGYDSGSDDYKVVRIAYRSDKCDLPGHVDVFSLRRGTWRNIPNSGFPYRIHLRLLALSVYLKGAAHWVSNDRRGREAVPLVLLFDMGSEVFAEFMLPESITREYRNEIVRLAKYRESLSLVTGVPGRDYCVWVMKEYGVPESWTKQFTIDMAGGFFDRIAGFTREGQVLVWTKHGDLEAFDLEAELMTIQRVNHGPPAMSSHRDACYADAYTESLVLFRKKFQHRITCEEERDVIEVEDQILEAKEHGP